LREALRTISSIRKATVGRRVTHGRGYEGLMRIDYQYIALLEFDDVAGLRAYLEHPAHETLAATFFRSFEEALMYDFELEGDLAGLERLGQD
jgi:seryl-tRNA(Sec) selenium transferase